MTLTPQTFFIVCPLLFLAGFVDSIGGGGGLISLPAYLIAGLPIHQAIATNKLSSTFGTALAALRFIKNRLVNFRLAVPSVIMAVIGSSLGANLSLRMDEKVMHYILFLVLPVTAFVVLNKNLFHDNEDNPAGINRRTYITAMTAAFIIGIYDGFYGPGTGTFLIIAFTVFAKMNIRSANAHTKVINLTTNLTALTVFLLDGQVLLPLGLAAAVCNMAGNYLGSGLVLTKGTKIVKPIILIVLFLLLLKILGIF
ncbi:MAG: TSUP family transporter [Eubacteriales bacterium]|nr:TSUP family transporter [Eubacteriales bacterium]